jgi:hypothetical protein
MKRHRLTSGWLSVCVFLLLSAGGVSAQDAGPVMAPGMRFAPVTGSSNALFVARTPALTIVLTSTDIVMQARGPTAGAPQRFQFADTAPTATVRGEGSSGPPAGPLGAIHYRQVRYRGLWEGIDAEVYDPGTGLTVAFLVATNADPSLIRVRWVGPDPAPLGTAKAMEVGGGTRPAKWVRGGSGLWTPQVEGRTPGRTLRIE